jgi:Protein of unknown function (DUF4232)
MVRHRVLASRSLHPRFAGGVVAVAGLSLVAACSSSGSPKTLPTPSVTPSTTSPVPSSSPSTAPTSSAPLTPSPVPSTSATTVVGPADCQSIHLALQAGAAQGAAGSTIATFILRNAGSTPCGMFGFPGVSFLNSAGAQIGGAEGHQGTAGPRFIVQPGQVASFQVQLPVAGCTSTPVQSTTIRVYPPNQTGALELAAGLPICTAGTVTAVKSGITQ